MKIIIILNLNHNAILINGWDIIIEKKSASSPISILLFLFLMACSASENNIVKNTENENQTTEDSFNSEKIGDLKKSAFEHFVIDNPNYKKKI